MANGKLQTLERGIETLLLIARNPAGLKVSELATGLGLHRAVSYRIVATLAELGMVQRLADGRVVLGSGAYLLGARSVDHVRTLARPVLEDLAEATGATAFLSMAEGDECVVALTAEPRHTMINIHYRVGTRHPITRGAAGFAILAMRPEAPNDIDEVRSARENGYSITRGQLHKGAVGVSSGIQLPQGGFAGLEFSIGVVALEELDLQTAAKAVPEAAQRLSDGFI